MDWISKLLGRSTKVNNPDPPLMPRKNTCPKCGNVIFSYDSFWDESCCNNCGLTVPGNFSKRSQTQESRNLVEFSYSRIASFEKCPKAYYFQYVSREKARFLSIEQHLGKSVHRALEFIYSQKKNGIKISRKKLINAFKETWYSSDLHDAKIVHKNTNLKSYLSQGQDMLEAYYSRILESDDSKTVAVERYLEMPLTESIFFRGYIDRISINGDGVLRITDFKTGKRVNDALFHEQLNSYALLCFHEYEVDEIELGIEDLRGKRTSVRKILRLRETAIRDGLIDRIKKIINTAEFETNPSILCHWCGYNSICDAALRLPRFR